MVLEYPLCPVARNACWVLALLVHLSPVFAREIEAPDGRSLVVGPAGARLSWTPGPGYASGHHDPGDGVDPSDPGDCLRTLRLPWGPVRTCRQAVVTGSMAGLGLVGYVKWWRKGLTSEWTTINEGWFGRGTYAGGVDKLAHGFSLYVGTRLLKRGLDWAGAPHQSALKTSAAIGLGAALAIEVFDALSKKAYGFSKEDLISGVLGVGLASLMESNPQLDRFFAFRMMYKDPIPTADFLEPLDDYERQVYLGALRLSGFRAIGRRNPLRYVEVVVGYGATGFDRGGGAEDTARRRTLYLGLGIDLTEVVQSLFFGTGSGGGAAQAYTTEALRYLQPPGTVLWSRSNR